LGGFKRGEDDSDKPKGWGTKRRLRVKKRSTKNILDSAKIHIWGRSSTHTGGKASCPTGREN